MSHPTPFGALDLQRIRRDNPELTEESIVRFDTALRKFRQSTRMIFFVNMQIGQFLSDVADSPIREATFLDLVELGTPKVCEREGMTVRLLERLTELLLQFVDEEDRDDAQPDLAADPLATARPRAPVPVRPDIPVYSSIEAEKRIEEGFRRLRSSKRFDELQHRQVGEFWETDLIRAPFIEGLTFRELTGMNVDDLLKKRSFGNIKIHALLLAMRDCCAAYGEPFVEPEQEDPVFEASDGNRVSQSAQEHSQPNWPTNVGSVTEAFAAKALMDWLNSTSASIAAEVLRKVLETSPVQQVLRALDGKTDEQVFEEIAGSAAKALELRFPVERKRLQVLLASPAVSDRHVSALAEGSEVPAPLEQAVWNLTLRGMGATPPRIGKQLLESHWTSKPEGFERIVQTLLSTLPRSTEALRADIESLLPFADAEAVMRVFRCSCEYDQESDCWRRAERPGEP